MLETVVMWKARSSHPRSLPPDRASDWGGKVVVQLHCRGKYSGSTVYTPGTVYKADTVHKSGMQVYFVGTIHNAGNVNNTDIFHKITARAGTQVLP